MDSYAMRTRSDRVRFCEKNWKSRHLCRGRASSDSAQWPCVSCHPWVSPDMAYFPFCWTSQGQLFWAALIRKFFPTEPKLEPGTLLHQCSLQSPNPSWAGTRNHACSCHLPETPADPWHTQQKAATAPVRTAGILCLRIQTSGLLFRPLSKGCQGF